MHGPASDDFPGSTPRSAYRKPSLICFSHLRWRFVTQRPQHLMVRASGSFHVVFVEEPWMGAETAGLDLIETDGITLAVPYLPHGLSTLESNAQLTELLRPIIETDSPRVFWYYTPAAVEFTRVFRRSLTIYDNMDELSAFQHASSDLPELERELLEAADLVFTGGRSLYEAKKERHSAVHCFPSSVDIAHFAQARRRYTPDPTDQSDLPRPRLGFFGVIDERMDLSFLGRFAALRPNWAFVMLGPVVKIDVDGLPRRANIHWLGMKAYAELPLYLAHWDLAFMPFQLNESTRFISPTKTPEFLAGGLRVISTRVTDVVRAYGDGLVDFVDTPELAATTAERLMAEQLMVEQSEAWLARVDARLRAQSWDRTWRSMQELMGDLSQAGERALIEPPAVFMPADTGA